MLDALDEIRRDNAAELDDVFREMFQWDLPSAQFLLTSRRESSVFDALESNVTIYNRMEIPFGQSGCRHPGLGQRSTRERETWAKDPKMEEPGSGQGHCGSSGLGRAVACMAIDLHGTVCY